MPKVLDFGVIEMKNFGGMNKNYDKKAAYYLMPKYEMNLKEYMSHLGGIQKAVKIIDVINKLLSIFKIVHSAQRTFNDLKPENIMVDTLGKLELEPKVHLIDFGFADKYISAETKVHISDKEMSD